MKRALLLSGGLTPSMGQFFWENVGKEPSKAKILYVPSAATEDDGAREGIAVCVYSLLGLGIRLENICTYNLKYLLSKGYSRTYSSGVTDLPREFRLMTAEELKEFDAIVVGGGHAGLLVDEMERTGFGDVLRSAVEEGAFYVGISAGSMLAAGNFENGLRFIENPIIPHCQEGSACGNIQGSEEIFLPGERAVWVCGDTAQIIE